MTLIEEGKLYLISRNEFRPCYRLLNDVFWDVIDTTMRKKKFYVHDSQESYDEFYKIVSLLTLLRYAIDLKALVKESNTILFYIILFVVFNSFISIFL